MQNAGGILILFLAAIIAALTGLVGLFFVTHQNNPHEWLYCVFGVLLVGGGMGFGFTIRLFYHCNQLSPLNHRRRDSCGEM